MSGLYFEQFKVDQVFKHPIRRTITETDNVWFSCITHNTQPLHIDEEFSKQTIFGQRIVNSMFTLALVTGMSVTELTLGTTLGNLGMTDVKFPKPLFHGDTLRSETRVLSLRPSQSRTDSGIVTFLHSGYNQKDDLVCECQRVALMLRQPGAQEHGE